MVSWGVLGSRDPLRTWPRVKIQARMECRAPAQPAAGSSGGIRGGSGVLTTVPSLRHRACIKHQRHSRSRSSDPQVQEPGALCDPTNKSLPSPC